MRHRQGQANPAFEYDLYLPSMEREENSAEPERGS